MPFTTTTKWALRKLTGASLVSDIDAGFDALAEDLDPLLAPFDQGTIAARPVSSVATPGKAGRRYYATDEGQEYLDLGTSWKAVGADPGYRVLHQDGAPIPGGLAAGTYLCAHGARVPSGGSFTAPPGVYFDQAHHAIPGKTLKLRITAFLISNSVAPGITINPALYQLGSLGGASGSALTLTVTTAVTTAAIAGAAAQQMVPVSSAEINAPATGMYIPGFNFAGSPAAGYNGFVVVRTDYRLV